MRFIFTVLTGSTMLCYYVQLDYCAVKCNYALWPPEGRNIHFFFIKAKWSWKTKKMQVDQQTLGCFFPTFPVKNFIYLWFSKTVKLFSLLSDYSICLTVQLAMLGRRPMKISDQTLWKSLYVSGALHLLQYIYSTTVMKYIFDIFYLDISILC